VRPQPDGQAGHGTLALEPREEQASSSSCWLHTDSPAADLCAPRRLRRDCPGIRSALGNRHPDGHVARRGAHEPRSARGRLTECPYSVESGRFFDGHAANARRPMPYSFARTLRSAGLRGVGVIAEAAGESAKRREYGPGYLIADRLGQRPTSVIDVIMSVWAHRDCESRQGASAIAETPTRTGGVLGAYTASHGGPSGSFQVVDCAWECPLRPRRLSRVALVMKGSPVRVRASACPQRIRRCAALGGTFQRMAVKESMSRRVRSSRGEPFSALRPVSTERIPGVAPSGWILGFDFKGRRATAMGGAGGVLGVRRRLRRQR
jgi:hypothetical protein